MRRKQGNSLSIILKCPSYITNVSVFQTVKKKKKEDTIYIAHYLISFAKNVKWHATGRTL